jgi:hypothetical protein
MKTTIYLFALIYMLAIQVACKEDCEKDTVNKYDLKLEMDGSNITLI